MQEKCEEFVSKVEDSVDDGPYKEMLLLMLEVHKQNNSIALYFILQFLSCFVTLFLLFIILF